MSNALRDAVESGANTFSDLVDQAKSRIEDLPPLASARRKRSRRHWSPVLVALLLALVVAVAAKRHHHEPDDHLITA